MKRFIETPDSRVPKFYPSPRCFDTAWVEGVWKQPESICSFCCSRCLESTSLGWACLDLMAPKCGKQIRFPWPNRHHQRRAGLGLVIEVPFFCHQRIELLGDFSHVTLQQCDRTTRQSAIDEDPQLVDPQKG